MQFLVGRLLREKVLSVLGSGLGIDGTLTSLVVFLSILGKLCRKQASLRCPKMVLGRRKKDNLEDEAKEKKVKSGVNLC